MYWGVFHKFIVHKLGSSSRDRAFEVDFAGLGHKNCVPPLYEYPGFYQNAFETHLPDKNELLDPLMLPSKQ